MKRADFLLQLDELLEQAPGTLQGPEILADNNWDSLSIVSFIALVDEHFGYTVPPRQLAQCKTVDDLVGLLGDRVAPVHAA
jgi:acyl carrier protein